MRPLLYLSSLLLALPGIVLASAFLILGSAIDAHSFFGFLGVLLDVFVWLIPWGMLACFTAFALLLVGGLTARFRWLASACVAALALGSSIVALFLISVHGNFSPGQLPFFIPGLVSTSIGTWLALREWPGNPSRQPPLPVPAAK